MAKKRRRFTPEFKARGRAGGAAGCGFQSIPITHSIPFRSLIPGDSDQ